MIQSKNTYQLFEKVIKDIVKRYKCLEPAIRDVTDPLIFHLIEDDTDEDDKEAIIATLFEALYGRDKDEKRK